MFHLGLEGLLGCVPAFSFTVSPTASVAALLHPLWPAFPSLYKLTFILPKSLCWSRASNTLTWAFCTTGFFYSFLGLSSKAPKRPILTWKFHLSLPSPSVVSFTAKVTPLNYPFFLLCHLFLHTRSARSMSLPLHSFSISQIRYLKKVIFKTGLSANHYNILLFYLKASITFLLQH